MNNKVNQIFGSDKDTETLALSNLRSVVLSSFYFDRLDDLFTSLSVGSDEVRYKEVSTTDDSDSDVIVSINSDNVVKKVIIGQEEIVPQDIVSFWSDDNSMLIETKSDVFKVVRVSDSDFDDLSRQLAKQSTDKVLFSSWEGMT